MKEKVGGTAPPQTPALIKQIPPEFQLIARHFRPLAGEGSLNLADDAALFRPPPDRELVISADAIVEGVHFRPDDPPDTIGQKLLRVNLSDLAAMGAVPLGYLLTVSTPRTTPDSWFAGFVAGLGRDQAEFGITLLGGDTTSTPGPISLTATVIGHVAPGTALRRAGAVAGDGIWVTGTIGDGALGLLALQGDIPDPDGSLADRYRLPRPRLGLHLAGIVHAAIDISDGLVQDTGHLSRAAGLSAQIWAAQVPLSAAARAAGGRHLGTCLVGGDDYELLLAVSADREPALQADCVRASIQVTKIGEFMSGESGVEILDQDGEVMRFPAGGWSHF